MTVSCEVRGAPADARLLGEAPAITRRLGIDQSPVDLSDPDARAWLEAFIWPEQIRELATLRAAVGLARGEPALRMARGEATTDTARMIADLPGDEPVAVFTASLMSYLDLAGRAAFAAQLDAAARGRPIAWVFAEGPGLLKTMDLDLPELQGALGRRNAEYAVGVSLRGAGVREDRLLALADAYLRWLAPARQAGDDFQWVTAGTRAG